MSSIWYQACKLYGTALRAVEFERETDSFLILKDGRRDAKETTDAKWFRTEAEALAAIADRIEKEDKQKAMLRVRNAAPDLLEALENLLGAYSKPDQRMCCSGTDCGCMGATIYDQAEHYARAAIARARGEA